MAEEQSEETKAEARQFMSDIIGSPDAPPASDGPLAEMAAWKAAYSAAESKDAALMETFWSSYYNAGSTSLWTMVYDEADSNENLDDTKAIATEFIKQTASLKDHCFGVIHTLESLEIQGLFFFNGPDPEQLFGANPETSWYTWSQLGPEANEHVKKAAASYFAPTDGQLNGKAIKDTQAFC